MIALLALDDGGASSSSPSSSAGIGGLTIALIVLPIITFLLLGVLAMVLISGRNSDGKDSKEGGTAPRDNNANLDTR